MLVSDDAGLPVAVALAVELPSCSSAALGALVMLGTARPQNHLLGSPRPSKRASSDYRWAKPDAVGRKRPNAGASLSRLGGQRTAVVVGSAPTTAAAIELWEAPWEFFDSIYVQTAVARVALPVPGEAPATVAVTASSDGGQFQVQSAEVLLDSLEAQGLDLESGCRRGVCHTCSVTLEAGCVTNAVDGTVSADGNAKPPLRFPSLIRSHPRHLSRECPPNPQPRSLKGQARSMEGVQNDAPRKLRTHPNQHRRCRLRSPRQSGLDRELAQLDLDELARELDELRERITSSLGTEAGGRVSPQDHPASPHPSRSAAGRPWCSPYFPRR